MIKAKQNQCSWTLFFCLIYCVNDLMTDFMRNISAGQNVCLRLKTVEFTEQIHVWRPAMVVRLNLMGIVVLAEQSCNQELHVIPGQRRLKLLDISDWNENFAIRLIYNTMYVKFSFVLEDFKGVRKISLTSKVFQTFVAADQMLNFFYC